MLFIDRSATNNSNYQFKTILSQTNFIHSLCKIFYFLPLRWWTSFFRVFNEIEDNINCVYANICLVQFIDTPQISVLRGDQQISLKVRTNIIRATSFVTLQRSIIETNRYWSAFDTENQHLCGLIFYLQSALRPVVQ